MAALLAKPALCSRTHASHAADVSPRRRSGRHSTRPAARARQEADARTLLAGAVGNPPVGATKGLVLVPMVTARMAIRHDGSFSCQRACGPGHAESIPVQVRGGRCRRCARGAGTHLRLLEASRRRRPPAYRSRPGSPNAPDVGAAGAGAPCEAWIPRRPVLMPAERATRHRGLLQALVRNNPDRER